MIFGAGASPRRLFKIQSSRGWPSPPLCECKITRWGWRRWNRIWIRFELTNGRECLDDTHEIRRFKDRRSGKIRGRSIIKCNQLVISWLLFVNIYPFFNFFQKLFVLRWLSMIICIATLHLAKVKHNSITDVTSYSFFRKMFFVFILLFI